MFLFLFSFAESLGKYPINRDGCSANVNGYVYNISSIASANRVIQKINEDWTFYMKLCGGLDSADLPNYSNIRDVSKYSVVRCSESKQICQPLTSLFSFDFEPLDSSNFEYGLKYSGNGEPVENNGKFITFDVIHQLKCSQSKTEVNPKVIVAFDDETDNRKIFLQYSTAYGCPVKSQVIPTPTPGPFNPKCSYTFGSKTAAGKGLEFDLSELNDGPGGWIVPTNKNTLFYQPCERMECPKEHYSCSTQYSSVWLCDDESKTCEDYGTVDAEMSVSLSSDDLNDGVTVSLKNNGKDKTAVIKLKGKSDLVQGSILFDEASISSNNIQISGVSESLTIKDIRDKFVPPTPTKGATPTPTPVPSQNPFFFFFNETSYVSMNLSSLEKQEIEGDISVTTGKLAGADMHWIVSPWTLKDCPAKFTCPIDKEANIWGCYDNKCYNYGSKFYGIKGTSSNFVSLIYGGIYEFQTKLMFSCDQSTASIDFSAKDGLFVENQAKEYVLNVKSKHACAQEFVEYIPKPTVTPEPDPKVRIDKKLQSNAVDGKITELDLTRLDTISGISALSHYSGYERALIYYSPSKRVECPKQYTCNTETSANIWKCYNESGKSTCYAFGDEKYGLNITTSAANSVLPDQYVASYKGGEGGSSSKVKFVCNESQTLSSGFLSSYDEEKTNDDAIAFTIGTYQVCSHAIDTPQSTDGSSVSVGAVFLCMIFGGFAIYFGFGTLIIFLCSSCAYTRIPNEGFWVEFAIDVKTGFLFLTTCERPYHELSDSLVV